MKLGLLTDVGRSGTQFYLAGLEHLGVSFVEEKLPTEEIIYLLKNGDYVWVEKKIENGIKNLKDKGCDHVAIACMTLQGMTGHIAQDLGMAFVNPCSYLDDITGTTPTAVIASSHFFQQYTNPNWILLPGHLQKHIDSAIWYAAIQKPFPCDSLFGEVRRHFESQGVECVLIACTDLTQWCSQIGWFIWTKFLPTKHLLMLSGGVAGFSR